MSSHTQLPRANPIFLREMRDAMRAEAKTDPWHFRLLVVGVILAAASYAAAADGDFSRWAPVVAFYVFALIESVMVMRPADPTSIVSRERQQNTFDPLFLTPLTPTRFLLGHLVFQVSQAARRACYILPFFGAVYVLGGFSIGQFVGYQLLLLLYVAAANVTMMAIANAMPAQGNDAAASQAGGAAAAGSSSLARRLSGRRANMANLNPMVFLVWFFVALVMIVPRLLMHTGPTIFTTLGTTAAPAAFDYVKGLALAHPFVTLLLWGDILLFGRPVPVWVLCVVMWTFVLLASWFTFVHQLTLRKFRSGIGYRAGRWLLLTVALLAVAAVLWRLPHQAALACLVLGSLYIILRFANPNGVPVRDQERYQILPRRDVLTHRAGNLIPFLLMVGVPIWLVQAWLVQRSSLPNLDRFLIYANAEIFLAVAAVLIGGLILRMRRERRRLEEETRANAEEPKEGMRAGSLGRAETAGDAQVDSHGRGVSSGRMVAAPPPPAPARKRGWFGRKRKAADPATGGKPRIGATAINPALGFALGIWLLPLPIFVLEPVLRTTNAGPIAALALRVVEPLLLVNPARFLFLLFSGYLDRMMAARPVNAIVGPPVLSDLPGNLGGLDYFQAALITGSVVVLILLGFYLLASTRLRRAQAEWAKEPAEAAA